MNYNLFFVTMKKHWSHLSFHESKIQTHTSSVSITLKQLCTIEHLLISAVSQSESNKWLTYICEKIKMN